jgi:hypothetical protein
MSAINPIGNPNPPSIVTLIAWKYEYGLIGEKELVGETEMPAENLS